MKVSPKGRTIWGYATLQESFHDLHSFWGNKPWIAFWRILPKDTMLAEAVAGIYFSSSDIFATSKCRNEDMVLLCFLMPQLDCCGPFSGLETEGHTRDESDAHLTFFSLGIVLWFCFFIFKFLLLLIQFFCQFPPASHNKRQYCILEHPFSV